MIIVNSVASIVPSLSSISCRKHLSALLRSSRERDACGKLKFPRYPAAKLCRVWVAARDWVKVLSMEKERGLESLTKLHKMRQTFSHQSCSRSQSALGKSIPRSATRESGKRGKVIIVLGSGGHWHGSLRRWQRRHDGRVLSHLTLPRLQARHPLRPLI